MNDLESRILKRFPERIESIDRLLAEDPDFQDLCEDYDICLNALQYWTTSGKPEAKTRVKEYRALAKEFEEEIHQFLLKPGY